MTRLVKPNFKRSNVNISATLAEFLHAPNANATLPKLKKELQKSYKNVVFICFDGMGMHPLKQNLPKQDFLRKHIVQKLRSTFPSTTTNATTSLISNTLPLQHGWFGWSVHFPQMNKNVNVFVGTDSWTDEKLQNIVSPLAHFPHYFDRANTTYKINTVLPRYVEVEYPQNNRVFENSEQFFAHISHICQQTGPQFAYCYFPEPDHSMHEVGVKCDATKQLLEEISHNMQHLYQTCPKTLFVVTADHGQVDADEHVLLFEDNTLMDMLEIYPYLEPRATAYRVKKDCHKQFEKHFKKHYGKDFALYKSSKLVQRGYFGDVGDKAFLLGDYISIAKTHKQALFSPAQTQMLFKGAHASLAEEMFVPLILISSK